jgi:hypothetical protein
MTAEVYSMTGVFGVVIRPFAERPRNSGSVSGRSKRFLFDYSQGIGSCFPRGKATGP